MEFTDFKELTKVLSSIPDIDLNTLTIITNLEDKGIDSKITTTLFNGPSGELLYRLPNNKVSKIAVHISAIKEEYKTSYKYHIFNCERLQQMRYDGKEEKYKSNSRTDGTFFMIMTNRQNQVSFRDFYPLQICSYCLKLYKNKYQTNFLNLEEYFRLEINNLTVWGNMPYDMEVAPQVYIKEWENISRTLKQKNNYRCERCNINLSNYPRYLHAHHVDMNVRNNHSENIKILCISCHGKEPNHIHVNSAPEWKEFMTLKQQGTII